MAVDNKNSKILTVSFMIAGFLTAVVVNVLLKAAASSIGAVARVYSEDWMRHGVPVTVGLLTFALLQFNKSVLVWGDEVVSEIRKIVWPSRKDTVGMTIVCCVMLLISSAILWFFDFLSGSLVQVLLR